MLYSTLLCYFGFPQVLTFLLMCFNNPNRSIICDTSHEIGIFQSLGATKKLLYNVRNSLPFRTRYLLLNQLSTYGAH